MSIIPVSPIVASLGGSGSTNNSSDTTTNQSNGTTESNSNQSTTNGSTQQSDNGSSPSGSSNVASSERTVAAPSRASTEALLQALGETGNSQKSAVIDNKVDPAFLTEDVAREMAAKLQRSIEDSLILQKIMAKSLTNPNLEVNQAETASRSDAPEAAERAYAEAKAET